MKKIITIYQKDIFPNMKEGVDIEYEDRNTGKAIVVDKEGKIALVGNNQNNFLSLPGGGIYKDENIKDGIIRECLEEIGCNVELLEEVGIIDDYRTRDKKHCINFCYIAKVVNEKGEPNHSADEASIGMYVVWVDIKEVLNIFKRQEQDLKDSRVTFYNTGFNILRDLKFLQTAIANDKIHE